VQRIEMDFFAMKNYILLRSLIVAESILDAIRDGDWNYEPSPTPEDRYESTSALPGSKDKVSEMAARVLDGKPLWHSEDRISYDESAEAMK
jgi:hypothetical protein